VHQQGMLMLLVTLVGGQALAAGQATGCSPAPRQQHIPCSARMLRGPTTPHGFRRGGWELLSEQDTPLLLQPQEQCQP
jgi:hypothetical protein